MYQSYFQEDRKSIHLHLNKNTFVSGEHIWFSSYLFNRRQNEVSLENEYLYVQLIDPEGTVVDSKTILHENGAGFGEFELSPELVSGDYYLQAYTANMNSFIEDESTVYKIEVLNFESQRTSRTSDISENLHIQIVPEGGQLVQQVFGTCGIRISDENDLPVKADAVFLQNSPTEEKIPIDLNDLGTGKFSLTPKKGASPMVYALYRGKQYSTPVPTAKEIGYSLSTVHDYRKKQVLVAIQTNSLTKQTTEDTLALLVHKDGNIFSLPIKMTDDETKSALIIPYELLYPGVNTLTLLRNNSQVAGERLVFNQPVFTPLKPQLLHAQRSKDSITLLIKNNTVGKEKDNLDRLSISVLPNESLSDRKQKKLFNSFFLDAYLPNGIKNEIGDLRYLEKNNAKYDLDKLLLLAPGNKYQWQRILNWKYIPARPLSSNLEGHVDRFEVENDSLTVLLYSKTNQVLEATALDKDKKFRFNEVSLAKGSELTLTLIDTKGRPLQTNFFFVLKPVLTPFNKPFKPKKKLRIKNTSSKDSAPMFFKNVEQLEEVVVTESRLKHSKFFGSFEGRKVDSSMLGYGTLGGYMKRRGLTSITVDPLDPDPRRAGSIQLAKKTVFGVSYPSIMINGVSSNYAMDYADIPIEQIDEVYFERKSFRNAGLFVVFTTDAYGNTDLPEHKKTSRAFVVANGYDQPKSFTRPNYNNLDSALFRSYGTVSWHPTPRTNEQGVVSIKIPDDGQKKIKLNLQGFGKNGQFLSESLLVDLTQIR